MSVLSVFFLLIATVCGYFAFGGAINAGMLWHIGFLLSVIGFLTVAVVIVARWAVDTLDDVPGERVRRSR